MTIFGRRETWAIELSPLAGPPHEVEPAAASTWCSIQLWAGGKNLTAHTRKHALTTADALYWPASNLARWFLHVWSGLWERAGWPLPGPVLDPALACVRLDERLAELGEDADDEDLELRDSFVESHTLLSAAGGGLMPHVYLMREGAAVHVVWREPVGGTSDVQFLEPQGRVTVDAREFLDAVVGFLDWCRVATAGKETTLSDQISEWVSRAGAPEAAEAVLRGYVQPWGVPRRRRGIKDLDTDLALPSGWRSDGARLDPSRFPVAVVFRALAPVLDSDDVLKIVARLQSYPPNPEAVRALDALQSRLVRSSRDAPHEQGYLLAEQLREQLGNPDRFLDVEQLLAEWSVSVDEAGLSDPSVDAATVWNEEHGPVIVLNRATRRDAPWARRMTLAHELCHLLLDRRNAAPLMIASSPWAPPELERRANAFAAELLLPKAGIQRVLRAAVRAQWVSWEDRLKLMDEFGVGETVCTHQLENRLGIGY